MREKSKSGRTGALLAAEGTSAAEAHVDGGGITRTTRMPLLAAEPGVLPITVTVCWARAVVLTSVRSKDVATSLKDMVDS